MFTSPSFFNSKIQGTCTRYPLKIVLIHITYFKRYVGNYGQNNCIRYLPPDLHLSKQCTRSNGKTKLYWPAPNTQLAYQSSHILHLNFSYVFNVNIHINTILQHLKITATKRIQLRSEQFHGVQLWVLKLFTMSMAGHY